MKTIVLQAYCGTCKQEVKVGIAQCDYCKKEFGSYKVTKLQSICSGCGSKRFYKLRSDSGGNNLKSYCYDCYQEIDDAYEKIVDLITLSIAYRTGNDNNMIDTFNRLPPDALDQLDP